VFLADLTVELCAWPQQTWTAMRITPEAAVLAVVDRWRAGHLEGLELGGVSVEEARALARPAMTYVREQFRARLAGEISRQYLALAAPDQPPPARRHVPVTHHDARTSASGHAVVPGDHCAQCR